mgnify:CR=1 FL=1
MTVQQALESRRSIKQYNPKGVLPDEQLRELFEAVRLTPSSFNIQHWSFIVVRDPAGKQSLMEAAFGQKQVGDCAAAVIIVADPDAYRKAGQLWRKSNAPEQVVERMESMIPSFYNDKPQLARDEALRSAGMAAMTLMLKATEMGLATGPMIGFDPEEVSSRFGIESPRFPAMLVVLGQAAADAPRHPRPYRREVSEIVRLENGKGRTL